MCVASIFQYLKNLDFEIIIVNNDCIRVNCSNEVAVINSGKNIGFGAACNLGAQKARGEVLLFLNPDTEILTEDLNKITDKFENDQKIGIIGPRLITSKGETQWWCAGREVTFKQLIKNNLGIIESKKIWESQKEISADWVSGTALFVRQEIFQRIGGFDENFFMYVEDLDLCRRIKKLGYNIKYYPEISVLHIGGKSRESLFKQKIQYFRAVILYLRKK